MFALVLGLSLAGSSAPLSTSQCWDLEPMDYGIRQLSPVPGTGDTMPHVLLPRGVKLFDDGSAGLFGYPHGAPRRETDTSFLIEPIHGASPAWALQPTPGAPDGEAAFTIEASASGPRSFHLRATKAECTWDMPVEPGYLDWLRLEPRHTPRPEPFYGGFAYSDNDGTRLLALSELAYPESVTRGVCQSGRRLEVRFLGVQERSQSSDGRQTARNFDYEHGALFEVAGGQAEPNETCFLIGPSLLALGALELPRRPRQPSCDPADSARITQAKTRRVVSCRRLATVGSGASVLSAEFEPQGDSSLASLVLTDSATLTFVDFAAENRPEDGTWRVGDGGEFYPDDFHLLLVIDAPGAKAMALTWAGEEGESSMLEVALAGTAGFEEVVRGYRYWVGY